MFVTRLRLLNPKRKQIIFSEEGQIQECSPELLPLVQKSGCGTTDIYEAIPQLKDHINTTSDNRRKKDL